MKKSEQKAMKKKLLVSFKKLLQDNKADLTNKIEKTLKKSIKKIVKSTNKKKKVVSEKIKKPVLNPDKIKTDKKLHK